MEFSNLIICMEFTKATGIPGKPTFAVDLSQPFEFTLKLGPGHLQMTFNRPVTCQPQAVG